MLIALGVLFLLLNIPLFRLVVVGETHDDMTPIHPRQLVRWLVVLAVFPVITYVCGEYFDDKDGIVDVLLQVYIAVCWIPIIAVFLIAKRPRPRELPDHSPPYVRLFTSLLMLLFGGLIANAVWLILRSSQQTG